MTGPQSAAQVAGPTGLVVVDKPAGLTSHDVVARLRRILRTRKIGHAGTLDPMATGVLVCGVGRGTKLLGHVAQPLAEARDGDALLHRGAAEIPRARHGDECIEIAEVEVLHCSIH